MSEQLHLLRLQLPLIIFITVNTGILDMDLEHQFR